MGSVNALGQPNDVTGRPGKPEGFIESLSPEVSQAFEDVRMATTYPAGALLFLEGDAPQGAFVLSTGRVKLSLTSPSGKVMILRIARAGEILGLHALISGTVLQATAQTLEPCRVSFVRREDFIRFLRGNPQAALLAAMQLSANYQETCEQLRSLGLTNSAREKVARFLLEWADHGELGKGCARVRLTLTHEEIGQLIGASRETITRILGDFKERHWITIRGSMLVLEDRGALEDVVGSEELVASEEPAARPARRAGRESSRLLVPRSFIYAKAPAPGVAATALHG